jgi:hypothetical protein
LAGALVRAPYLPVFTKLFTIILYRITYITGQTHTGVISKRSLLYNSLQKRQGWR